MTEAKTFVLKELPLRKIGECNDPTNCFGYILGEKEKVDLRDFLKVLAERGYVDTSIPCDGDIILYGNSKEDLLHAGIFREGRMVDSKFGDNPSIFRHQISHSSVKEYGKVMGFLTRKNP